MYRVSYLAVFLLLTVFSIPAMASTDDKCAALQSEKKKIDQSITEIRKKYPKAATYYGFSSFMVRGDTSDVGAYFIIRIAESVKKCSKLVEGKKCDLAAGEIIQLIKGGLAMCKAASKNNCNIC